MYKPFEQRRSKCLVATGREPKLYTVGDLLRTSAPPSSEDRLLKLPVGSWTPGAFAASARHFIRETGFSMYICENGEAPPNLGSDVTYKYTDLYYEVDERIAGGEHLLVAVVMEGERVIGYGIANRRDTQSEIEIIDVDSFSRRSTGLQRTLTIDGVRFGVGVGHVLVELLAAALNRPIFVDATHDDSRYIFKSLGFVSRPGEQNPCLLQLSVNSKS